MRRWIALFAAVMLCLSLCACGDKVETDDAREAYELIDDAYEVVDEFASDLYEAWFQGVNHASSVTSLSYLKNELTISDEMLDKAIESKGFSSWTAMMDVYDDSFSPCVELVSEAYKVSGKLQKVRNSMEEAAAHMHVVSQNYDAHEAFYDALKDYYKNTALLLDFCCSPEGSFEQVVSTMREYRNGIRSAKVELEFVFGEFEDVKKPKKELETWEVGLIVLLVLLVVAATSYGGYKVVKKLTEDHTVYDNNRPEEEDEETGKGTWVCKQCGAINPRAFSRCADCRTDRFSVE
ncbi:MAG: hypothetical protein IKV35_01945 [Clostridia bacterium]|nr:hypothetical protein [Clostridia bacterium]